MNNTEEENNEIIQVSMKVLQHAGDARKLLVKSLEKVADNKIKEARQINKEANEKIVKAHAIQTEILQKEASGEYIRYSTLFSHAQDTMMTAKSEILIGQQLINIFEQVFKQNNNEIVK